MGNYNLSRAETSERAKIITVDSYVIDLDLSAVASQDSAKYFLSTTTVSFACSEVGASTWIDLQAESVRSITLNGESIDPATAFDGDRIALDSLAAANQLTVVADCRYMRTGEGLHRFIDPVDGEVYLYTQFETADSRRMYAVFEQPALKATFTLSVTGPDHWTVLSNSPTPEPTAVREGIARWDFATTKRMSSYITALVAGPYSASHDEYVGPNGTYPLGVYCRASMFPYLDPETIFLETKQGFAFFEEAFGTPYPFGKYDQIFVPEFNAGAMENAGCVTFLEDYVFRSRVTDAAYETRANTILHELAHMWFGDLVTMTWWDDLWLNESFAEWASHHASVAATRYTDAWTTFLSQRKTWAYRQDQLPSTHPIATDMTDLETVALNFDGITYAKGASALRQMVAYVGEDEFFAGIRNYFAKHAWGNTTLQDLLDELEAASGRPMAEWAAAWLQTSGVNLLRPITEVDENGKFARVAIVQEPPASPAGLPAILRPHRLVVGLYNLVDGVLSRTQRVEVDVAGAVTEVPALAGVAQPDLLLVNDEDWTYAKIRLDDRSLRTAVESIGSFGSSLPRTLVWGAAWDMVRDGEMTTGDYLRLAISGLPHESEIGPVQIVLRQVHSAIDQYAADANRESYAEEFAAATARLMREAEAGSDHQLAFARAHFSSASTAEQLDFLAGLLDGTESLTGLAVDTDLRWAILTRLVATGRFGESAIDAELQRDNTASGLRQASVARSSRPTPEAKYAAWHAVVDTDDLPNALLEATMAGFTNAEPRTLLLPYRDQYFDVVEAIWSSRTPDSANSIATGLFPFLQIDEETLAAADAFLSRDGLATGLRRVVSEGRDGVARALRCRACDAAG